MEICNFNSEFETSEFEYLEFEHLEFENSEFENSEFKNSELEHSEFEHLEFKIEKKKGFFFGLESGSKTCLGPTYVDNHLWFWKYSQIFLILIWPHLGPLLHFLGPSELFGGCCQVQKLVWDLPM